MLTRRLILLSAAAMAAIPSALVPAAQARTPVRDRFAEIEETLNGGRLGVAWLGPGAGTWTGHRENERFLMCSAFKAFLAACVLFKAHKNELQLSQMIAISKSDLKAYAPVVEAKLASGASEISRLELCQAAVTLSDNAAANLLLRDVGGPERLTAFMRGLGDAVTRMDRWEPELNTHDAPDDERDTSTPLAFGQSLRKLLFGGGLPKAEAHELADWMRNTHTGDARIRAGVPAGWDIGDKTGNNGDAGEANDAAFFTRPSGGSHVLVAFCDAPNASDKQRDAAIAEAARRVAASIKAR